MITWDQRNQWLGQMRARIAAKVAGVQPRAGYGVVVQGEVISLDPVSRPPPPERRTWSYVIFAQVTMTQNFSTSEPGQVSGVFEYEPRYVGTLPSTAVDGDYLPGVQGLPMLPTIISANPHPDEAFAGVVFQEDVTTPSPSTLDKFATVTLYVRGWWDDSQAAPVFADAFAVGRMDLTLTQTQSVVTGAPPDIVTLTEDSKVTASYAGASLLFNAFPTAANAPGDSTATIAITAARRP